VKLSARSSLIQPAQSVLKFDPVILSDIKAAQLAMRMDISLKRAQ
jgi:hypothetical protein